MKKRRHSQQVRHDRYFGIEFGMRSSNLIFVSKIKSITNQDLLNGTQQIIKPHSELLLLHATFSKRGSHQPEKVKVEDHREDFINRIDRNDNKTPPHCYLRRSILWKSTDLCREAATINSISVVRHRSFCFQLRAKRSERKYRVI